MCRIRRRSSGGLDQGWPTQIVGKEAKEKKNIEPFHSQVTKYKPLFYILKI